MHPAEVDLISPRTELRLRRIGLVLDEVILNHMEALRISLDAHDIGFRAYAFHLRQNVVNFYVRRRRARPQRLKISRLLVIDADQVHTVIRQSSE